MRAITRGPIGLVFIALVAGACSSSAPAAPSSAPATVVSPVQSAAASSAPAGSQGSTPPVATASKGPATSDFSITGTSGLTGPVTAQTIQCNRPSLGGSQIFFLGQSGSSGPSIVLFLSAGHIEARVGTGSAATLRERDFEGTGLTSFDPASGARFDSTLTETTAPGSKIGNLGALTRISGSIDCGNQEPGSANLVISGLTPYGQLDGALTGVSVGCNFYGSTQYVGVVGLGMAGSTPVLVFATASDGTIQVTVETGKAATGYLVKGTGLTTLTPTGATMTADVFEQVPAGASPSPNTLHVAGNATCGTTTHQ